MTNAHSFIATSLAWWNNSDSLSLLQFHKPRRSLAMVYVNADEGPSWDMSCNVFLEYNLLCNGRSWRIASSI